MKLYTNGCSFTHGHGLDMYDLEENVTHEYKGYKYLSEFLCPFVWPWLLNDKFDFIFNHACHGTGIDRLLRTTIDFVEFHQDEDWNDWLFILQISQPLRKEILHDSGFNIRYHYLDDWMEPNLFDIPSEQVRILPEEEQERARQLQIKLRSNPQYRQSLHYYMSLIQGDQEILRNHLKNYLLLTQYLDKKGIRYVITGMSKDCHNIKHMNITSDTNKLLANLLPQEHILDKAIGETAYSGPDSIEDDGHPNPIGHRNAARYIIKELKKRKYI